MTGDDLRRAAVAWVRASLSGDPAAIRSRLADVVRIDWGGSVWTDPDEFAAACDHDITWQDIEVLAVVADGDRAAIVYEATNRDEGVRVRTGEHLRFAGAVIAEAVATVATVPLP